jgi:hypothetical protein
VNNPASLQQFRAGTGAPNAYPLVGPVVINEIMFDPIPNGAENNTDDEYIELLNTTLSTLPLYDPAAPTNTWKVAGAIQFTFPTNTTLAPHGLLLLVNFNPAADQVALAEFRARYNVSNTVPLFGPFSGHLDNAGESVELYKPDPPQQQPHPDAGFVPYVLVERVNYSASSPWPINAAGTGSSLQRQIPLEYGNDPANWFVAAPTAGRANPVPVDADSDGLPDAWEIQYFGSISDLRATPGADPDGDGFNNLQEYVAGTNPLDSNSSLRFDSVECSPGGIALQFNAVAGKTYSIVFRTTLGTGVWSALTNLPAATISGPVIVADQSANASTRFYRLSTP